MTISKTRPFWLLLMMVSFVFALFAGTQTQASTLPSSVVDSISSSRAIFDPRENGDVTVNFSEKAGHEFQPGDVLELTLPMELQGFNKNFMLEDYANVTVTENRVRVVFTDKVAKKNNIHGSLWFGVHASETVTKGTTKDVVLDLGTQCKHVPTIKVKGYDAVSGPGDQKYAYKGGWVNKQDPTLIDWYIVVNPQRLYMSSDVFVRDILGAGHEYVQGSILVNQKPINPNDVLLSMGGNNFSLQLRRDVVSTQNVEIRYQTKIVGAGMKQAELKNDFTADYQVLYQQPAHLAGSFKVKNVMFDGDIEGDDDLNHATEGDVPGVDGDIEEIPEEKIEQGIVEEEEDVTHRVTEDKQTEMHVPTVEEKVIEEGVVETKDVETEHVEGKVEEDQTTERVTEETQPEVNVPTTDEEVVEEEVTEIKDIETEQIEGKVEDDKVTEHGTETTPEQHVDPIEEEKVDEIVVPIPDQQEETITPDVEPEHWEEVKGDEVVDPKIEVKKDSKAKKVSTSKTKTKNESKAAVKKEASVKKADAQDKELPKTGSVNNATVAIAGMMLLIGTVGARRRFTK